MLTTIEAEIDVDGNVTLLEPLKLRKKSRAIVTLLESENVAKRPLSEEEERLAKERFARWIGAGNSGDPNSADNERIDADLAREYANTHEVTIQPKQTPLGARERREAMDELLRYAGAVSGGNPRAADNEEIDADLAREYGKDI